jgi:hypothetical protein
VAVRVTVAERPVTIVAFAVSVTGTFETLGRANAAATRGDNRIASLTVPRLRTLPVAVPSEIGCRTRLGSSLSRCAVAADSVAVTAHWAAADSRQVSVSRRSAAAVARPPGAKATAGVGTGVWVPIASCETCTWPMSPASGSTNQRLWSDPNAIDEGW